MRRGLLIGAVACMLAALPARGQEVEVIGRDEIAALHPSSLIELLTRRVGISESGGNLAIRGVPKVAVQVDGHAWDSTLVALERLRVEDIERIEIYRGAASARFGAQALGGALAITTRRQGGKTRLAASQTGDSLGGHQSRIEAETGLDRVTLGLTAEDSRHWRTFNIDPDNNPFDHLAPVERSYTDRRVVKAEAGTGDDDLNARLGLEVAQDAFHWGRPNYYRDDTSAIPHLSVGAAWGETTLAGSVEVHDVNINMLRDKGGRDGAGLDPNMRLWEHDQSLASAWELRAKPVRLGLNYRWDTEDSEQTDYASGASLFRMYDAIETVSADSAVAGELFGGLRGELAGRWDRYRYLDTRLESPGGGVVRPETVELSAFNPKVSLGWAAGGGVDLHGSVGKGFVPPSPSSLYYREASPTLVTLANPNLRPEKSWTWDVGASAEGDGVKAGVTLFHTLWRDKMEAVTTPGTPAIAQMRNIGSSRSRGVELSMAAALDDGWSAEANATFTDTRILQSADRETVGNRLPNMPTARGTLAVARRWGEGWNARTQMTAVSSQFTDSRNLDVDANGTRWRKDAYWTMDAQVSHPLTFDGAEAEAVLAVDNVFDCRYEKKFFEIDPGRVIRLQAVVKF
ncbi:MAG TPA: TonB-dependent receptor [Magnetospirillum sp.]|nr:TonB-dependent receptor [Magnetospirillum sp.]